MDHAGGYVFPVLVLEETKRESHTSHTVKDKAQKSKSVEAQRDRILRAGAAHESNR